VLIHCDVDTPYAKPGSAPAYLEQIKAVFKRHQNATIIWAHVGVAASFVRSRIRALSWRRSSMTRISNI
jgi:hypothetical protein